ncbi:MAG: hypothetical protein MJE63_09730 [Proteobacteria bacterium]|nr:hypothetical protein [Pseudomonadota bacterium]
MSYSTQFEEVLRSRSQIIRILWFALTGSILIYIVLGYVAPVNSGSEPTELDPTFKNLLYIVGFLTAISSQLIKKFVFSDERVIARLSNDIKPSDLAINTQTNEVNEKELQKLNELSEKELKIISLVPYYFTPFIIQMALYDAVTIFGLLLSFMSHNFVEILPFAIVSLFLCLTTYNGLNKLIEKGKIILDNPNLYNSKLQN